MSNVMSMKSLRNKVSRNGFDLSRKNCFTAKAGELLPVMVEEVLPGDKFNIDLQWFTRTQTVNTAAYTRIREYYDFYFVPTRQLWRDFPAFVTQVPNQQHALSLTNNAPQNGRPFTLQPYTTSQDLAKLISAFAHPTQIDEDFTDAATENFFGYNRAYGMCKLLDYLGYGRSWYDFVKNDASFVTTFFSSSGFNNDNRLLNIFPILAYQKIYADYYRNSQWEKIQPSTFNVDYFSAFKEADMDLELDTLYSTASKRYANYNMFDMRYCDWNKDYFMGLLPQAQYGDETLASPLKGSFLLSDLSGQYGSSNDDTYFAVDDVQGTFADSTYSSGLSVIALRKAEAMQRWQEITQSGDYDYKTQLSKHWNVDTSDFLSEKCRYLGGTSGNLDISEVVNTNLADDNESTIAGKGVGSGKGKIEFDAKEHGYIICIYHCVPLLDYMANISKPLYRKVYPTDYAIPEFDKVGMQSIPFTDLVSYLDDFFGSINLSAAQLAIWKKVKNLSLGYAPRYVEYKTSVDEVHGAFNDTLLNWVAPVTSEYLLQYFLSRVDLSNVPYEDISIMYDFFKVNPGVLDTIFGVNADQTEDTDQFLINSYFDVKAVRNLDYNGLPY